MTTLGEEKPEENREKNSDYSEGDFSEEHKF